jgi:hypothetical protein
VPTFTRGKSAKTRSRPLGETPPLTVHELRCRGQGSSFSSFFFRIRRSPLLMRGSSLRSRDGQALFSLSLLSYAATASYPSLLDLLPRVRMRALSAPLLTLSESGNSSGRERERERERRDESEWCVEACKPSPGQYRDLYKLGRSRETGKGKGKDLDLSL